MNIIPVSSYPYAALSASYPHDRYIGFNPYFQQFNNGYYMFKHDVFKSVNDLSFNKYTGFFVTNKFKQKDIIKSSKIINREEYKNARITLYTFATMTYVSVGEDGILYADKYNSKDASIFTVYSNEDGTISLNYSDRYVLMCEDKVPWRVKLHDNQSGSIPEDSYKFKIEKFKDNYVISTSYGEASVNPRFLKSSVNEKFVGFFGTTLGDLGSQLGIDFKDYTFIPDGVLEGTKETSWFYSYFNDSIDFENNANVNPNFSNSVSGVKQNFFLSIPYETKIETPFIPADLNGEVKVSTMELDVIGLKNVKNPNYQYSKLPYNRDKTYNYEEIDPTDLESEVNKREFKRLFTGTNQEHGMEMPVLSYSTNNKAIRFLKDNTTYFHYPKTAPSMKLSESGLIEAGAFPSRIPFYSDKIFKKDAGYGAHKHWGNSTQFRNGQWLCSWLSGNGKQSVWMDRWYNPAEISTFAALTAEYPEEIACGAINAKEGEYSVMDVPTVMTFEPEVWYKYFRVGESFIEYAVDEVINYKGEYMKLHFDDWQLSAIKDKTNNGNNGQFVNFSLSSFDYKLNDVHDNVGILNGTNQYITIPYSDTVKTPESNSFSIWVHSDDWSKIKSSEIISNGIGNYYNLRVTNGLDNPISVIFAESTNKLILFNNENKVYNIINMPSMAISPKIKDICIDSNLNTWAFDSNNAVLYKINYIGLIDIKLDFPKGITYSNLTLNPQNEACIVDLDTGSLSAVDINGLVRIESTDFQDENIKIDFRQDGVVEGHVGKKVLMDNRSYPWILSLDSKNLNRFTTPILRVDGSIDDFIIDHQGYIWVLCDENRLTKLDSVGNIISSVSVPINRKGVRAGCLMIVNDFYKNTEADENFIVVLKNNYFYRYDSELRYLGKISSAAVPYENMYVAPLTDWSGYNFKRKFAYSGSFEGVSNLELSFMLSAPNGDIKEYKLSIPVTRLYKGWHHFAGVFNQEENIISFFVDGKKENRILSVEEDSKMYVGLKNSMILGAKMGQVTPFNKELSILEKYHFKGKIDDFRIYHKALTELDVEILSKTKQQFFDLNWHIPTGVLNYAEEIQQFFKHKMPGSKSNFYNVNIVDLGITDESIRILIEDIIRKTVKKITPAYTELYKINWLPKVKDDVIHEDNVWKLEFTIKGDDKSVVVYVLNPVEMKIDWGDGLAWRRLRNGFNKYVYEDEGTYIIKIKGQKCDNIRFIENKNIIPDGEYPYHFLTRVLNVIPKWNIKSFYRIFCNCTRLISIPNKLFSKNNNATSFEEAFYNCRSLENIFSDLFLGQVEKVNMRSIFNQCYNLKSLPYGIFDELIPNVPPLAACANCRSITNLPENLFNSWGDITDLTAFFSDCINLKSLPNDLFSNNVHIQKFNAIFQNCSSLESIPENLFVNNVDATSFYLTFGHCGSLKTIPENLFTTNELVTSFSGIFQHCKSITEIPSNLFSNNVNAKDFEIAFFGCGIKTIPEDLFKNNISVTTFKYTFSTCLSLSSIPSNLFKYNTNVKNFKGVFAICSNLLGIPNSLFENNNLVEDFSQAFSSCYNLMGVAPDLWNTHSTANGFACFRGDNLLLNYNLIPPEWK